MKYKVETFFDKKTSTLTYIVYDNKSMDALVIDPVLNYDQASSALSTESIDEVLKFVNEKKLNLLYALETHAHADHMSGAYLLKERVPGLKIAINENITKVQKLFKGVFNLDSLKIDGSQFDTLLKNNENFEIGSIKIKTLSTPGHTPACSSFLIDSAVFTGDALLIPDSGTGRCDFPAGSSKNLYDSVHNKLYALPDETLVYVGHDYQPGGRELQFKSSIGEEKKNNIQLKTETTEDSFIEMRTTRDKTLSAPKLLLPSLQVNIEAGALPIEEENGSRYLKIPLAM